MAQPQLVRLHDAADLALDVGIGVVLYRALRAPELIVITDPTSPAATFAALIHWVTVLGMLAWLLLVIVGLGSTLWRCAAPLRARVTNPVR